MTGEYEWIGEDRILEREIERYVHSALNQQVSEDPVDYEELAFVLEEGVEQNNYPVEQVLDAFMTSEYVVEEDSGYKLRGQEFDVPFEQAGMPEIPLGRIDLRQTVEGALAELVQSVGTYYSAELDESTTVLGDEEFAEKAWESFAEAATMQEEEEVHNILKDVVFAANYQPLAEARENSAAYQKFRNKQREILLETFDSDTIPLLRGIGPKYVASRSPVFEYEEPSSDSREYFITFDEEQVQEVFDHVKNGTTVLNRDRVDSWSSNPSGALKFATNTSEDAGFILRQNTDLREIAHSTLVFPGDLSESEFTVFGDRQEFQPEQFTPRKGMEEGRVSEEDWIWLYRNLP